MEIHQLLWTYSGNQESQQGHLHCEKQRRQDNAQTEHPEGPKDQTSEQKEVAEHPPMNAKCQIFVKSQEGTEHQHLDYHDKSSAGV